MNQVLKSSTENVFSKERARGREASGAVDQPLNWLETNGKAGFFAPSGNRRRKPPDRSAAQ
jgi:hypothetical protein